MFGDNKSVINSSVNPSAKLHKRHGILAFHRVCEAIASKVIGFYFIWSESNAADILSKHWSYSSVWGLLQAILHWEGDTANLIDLKIPTGEQKPWLTGELFWCHWGMIVLLLCCLITFNQKGSDRNPRTLFGLGLRSRWYLTCDSHGIAFECNWNVPLARWPAFPLTCWVWFICKAAMATSYSLNNPVLNTFILQLGASPDPWEEWRL